MRSTWILATSALFLTLGTASAQARATDAGPLTLTAAAGPSFKVGSRLGGSGGNLTFSGQAEYAFNPTWSALGELSLGIAGTVPLQVRAGARYRFVDFKKLPVSPFVQGQLALGRMFDVIGANLTIYGLRLAGGADYALRTSLRIGGLIAYQITRTSSARPTTFGAAEFFVFAGFGF